MLITKFWSQNFDNKVSVTKFWSQNIRQKNLVRKFQSKNCSHKFQSHNCSHKLTFSQCLPTNRPTDQPTDNRQLLELLQTAKTYRVPELASLIGMRIWNSAVFYKFCSPHKLTLRRLFFSCSHYQLNFVVVSKKCLFSFLYYCHYCHQLLSLNSCKGHFFTNP